MLSIKYNIVWFQTHFINNHKTRMSMRYRFKELKKQLKRNPFQKYWYRIEKYNQNWYITYETLGTQQKVDFIMKRLWAVECWRPVFYVDFDFFTYEWTPSMIWMDLQDEHWKQWRCWRLREKKESILNREIEKQKLTKWREWILYYTNL